MTKQRLWEKSAIIWACGTICSCFINEASEVGVRGVVGVATIVHGFIVSHEALIAFRLVNFILAFDDNSIGIELCAQVPEVSADKPLWKDEPGVEVDVSPCEHHELVHACQVVFEPLIHRWSFLEEKRDRE